MPPQVTRVSLLHEGADWVEVADGRPLPEPPARTTFSHWASKWGTSALFEHIRLPPDLPGFVQDLRDGQVIGCQDGFF